MYTTHLRKVGGSIMLAVPPALLEVLAVGAGSRVGLCIEDGRLVVVPETRRRYQLQELLAEHAELPEVILQDREWLDDEAVGEELL